MGSLHEVTGVMGVLMGRERLLYDYSYQQVLNYAEAQGYTLPSAQTQFLDNQQVLSLKSTGVWDLLDVFYEYATDADSDFACINWKSPGNFNCLKVNSPAHALGGFTGNGTTSYLNTQWNPLNNGVNYQLNSANFGYYVRENILASKIQFGARSAGTTNLTYETAGTQGYINQNDPAGGAYVSNLLKGLRIIGRTSSTARERIINGVTESALIIQVSVALTEQNLYVLALNLAGSPSSFAANTISMAFTGGNLTGKHTDFYNTIQTRMTALGIAV